MQQSENPLSGEYKEQKGEGYPFANTLHLVLVQNRGHFIHLHVLEECPDWKQEGDDDQSGYGMDREMSAKSVRGVGTKAYDCCRGESQSQPVRGFVRWFPFNIHVNQIGKADE